MQIAVHKLYNAELKIVREKLYDENDIIRCNWNNQIVWDYI